MNNWWNKSSEDPFLNVMIGIGFIIYGLLTSLFSPLYISIYTLLLIIYYLM